MQAYRRSDLYNRYVHREATEALQTGCINSESHNKILLACPSKLYTPNYFIRIALAVLTIVAVLFSALLLWLVSSPPGTSAITKLLILLAILCYIMLELLVKRKQYYNAGMDNILMTMAIVFTISTFFISDYKISWLFISCMTMIIAVWCSIRFTDAFMALVAYCSLFMFLFLAYVKLGNIAKATAPLVMMAVSALVYFVMKEMINRKTFMYRFCFKAVTLFTLLTFYASGNYFIVKEVSNQMFGAQSVLHNEIYSGRLLWLLTVIIPPGYILYGIIKKNVLFIRTGLGLIAATILTVTYYYPVVSIETEMLIAGIILIVISYALIRSLKEPKYGFTSYHLYGSGKEMLNAEALIIAETFNKHPTVESPGLYGGGSGGGGGSTGDY